MRSKSAFSNSKSEWKRQCDLAQFAAEQIQRKARAGDIITLSDVYSTAHRIKALGDRGLELAKEAAALGMSERVSKDIGQVAHYLEAYSAGLLALLEKRRMYTGGFPLYHSTLDYTVIVETDSDPLDSLDRIMGQGSI